MRTQIEKKLEQQADKFLRQAGYNPNGQPAGQKSQSIRTIGSVPIGGANDGYRMRFRRP